MSETSGSRRTVFAGCLLAASCALLLAPAGRASETEDAARADAPASATEVSKQLSNPVSELWSITFQQNNFRLKYQLPGNFEDARTGNTDDGERWSSNLLFQPVLPIAISDEWNLITRPVIPLFVSQPHPTRSLDVDRTTAFGDITLLNLVSPSSGLVGDWLLGVGPTWVFPTAASDYTGFGKYQVGPAALVGYLSKKWIAGALVQNWTSFGGSDTREQTNSMNLQPIAAYFLRDGWSIGYSGNVLANWKESGGDVWTVPIGVGISKVVKLGGKLPVKLMVAGQYMPIHPDQFGQKWNVQLVMTPVLPKLIKGNLVDPGNMIFGLR